MLLKNSSKKIKNITIIISLIIIVIFLFYLFLLFNWSIHASGGSWKTFFAKPSNYDPCLDLYFFDIYPIECEGENMAIKSKRICEELGGIYFTGELFSSGHCDFPPKSY